MSLERASDKDTTLLHAIALHLITKHPEGLTASAVMSLAFPYDTSREGLRAMRRAIEDLWEKGLVFEDRGGRYRAMEHWESSLRRIPPSSIHY